MHRGVKKSETSYKQVLKKEQGLTKRKQVYF